jgi:hypothetical protein
MIRAAKGDKSIPEYLLNFKQPINYSRKETVAAFKTGQYRLTQEERQLNKLRQAVTMNDTNKIDKILPEMGIFNVMKTNTTRYNERIDEEEKSKMQSMMKRLFTNLINEAQAKIERE